MATGDRLWMVGTKLHQGLYLNILKTEACLNQILNNWLKHLESFAANSYLNLHTVHWYPLLVTMKKSNLLSKSEAHKDFKKVVKNR